MDRITNPAARLEARLRALLPEMYDSLDREIRPVSMGSAGLRLGADGRVAWDEIWGSFCDLAMAGGPPHRGGFLAPHAGGESGEGATGWSGEASAEICRALTLVTGLFAELSPAEQGVRLFCTSAAMSGWLARAIVMENVWAVSSGLALDLPAGPAFRIEKEIKNVITTVAKTCHYWRDHMSEEKRDAIAELLREMEGEGALLYPDAAGWPPGPEVARTLQEVAEATGFGAVLSGSPGWCGLDCRDVAEAVWMMRALAVSNLLSRREGTVVFFPCRNLQEATGRSVRAVVEAHRLLRSAISTR